MTNSTSSSTVTVSGTHVMQGASRGLDQPTLLAFVSFAGFSPPEARPVLLALDAGLCNRSSSMADRWRQFRASRLTTWAGPGPADPEGIASVVLWLWTSLQQEYGNPSSEGVLRAAAPDGYELAVPYLDPELAHVTLRYTVEYVNQAIAGVSGGSGPAALEALRRFFEAAGRHISSPLVNADARLFLSAANDRCIPWNRLTHDIYQLGWGCKARRLTGTHTDRTPVLAQRIAKNKAATRYLLSRAGFPAVRYGWADSEDFCASLAERIGYPVVVKPVEQDRGQGVAIRLTSSDDVRRAYRTASQFGPVLVEQHVEGNDYRLLVVDGALLAAAHRVPGGVTGDGCSTVRDLVDQANADPRRGTADGGLTCIALDAEAAEMLRKQGLTFDAVPEPGRFVSLREVPTVAKGGVPVDVTGLVHRDNRLLVERACRIVGLDVAGVDFLCPDITKSWRAVGGTIIEVNSGPELVALRLARPQRDLCGEILDRLFDGGTGRIPVAAVAGATGQEVVSRLLHRILGGAGICTGTATRRGGWIGDSPELDGDVSGSLARDVLLTDPSVEAAVVEVSSEGLSTQGHPCDRYTVAGLVNVSKDVEGGRPPEMNARVLAEVLERATEAVVVDGEDPLCLAMLDAAAPGRRIVVGRSAKGVGLQSHLAAGGEAVFIEEEADPPRVVIVGRGRNETLAAVADLTDTNREERNVDVKLTLFAVALAYALGVNAQTIRKGLTATAGFDAARAQPVVDIAGGERGTGS